MVEDLRRVWSAKDLGGTRVFSFEIERIFPLLQEVTRGANRILEVGAGDGRMIRLLNAEGINGQFHAIDITDRVHQAPALAVVSDARALPFCDGAFNVVYSLGVVEHFPQTAEAIAEHARVTDAAGFVFVTTPHLGLQTALRWMIYLMERRFRDGSFEVVSGRELSLRHMKRLVSQAGLLVVECAATGRVLHLSLPGCARRMLQRLMPEARFGSYLYLLAKKPKRNPLSSRLRQSA